MNLKCKELKRIARETLVGRYGLPMAVFVVAELLIVALTTPFQLVYQSNPNLTQSIIFFLATIIISLLSVVLSSGVIYFSLNFSRGKEAKFTDLFYCFRHHPDRYILSALLYYLVILASLIPAIICLIAAIIISSIYIIVLAVIFYIASLVVACIISLSYGMVFFILVDDPSCGVVASFRRSRAMMKGSKGRLFYIGLSFIGWMLLCALSFGIGLLWVGPYMTFTQTNFYRNLIGEI